MGYLSRRSPITNSRTEAPLAQCEPRLIGESQLGSCPIHTPLDTSAVTVQPTAQCVQIPFRMVAPAVSGPAAAASAFRTLVGGRVRSGAGRCGGQGCRVNSPSAQQACRGATGFGVRPV